MSEEVRERLRARFPLNRHAVIECDEGWDDLLDRLDQELVAICPDYTIDQVKEKFGALRFYISAPVDAPLKDMYAVIDRYEEESVTVCEECGQPGTNAATRRWWRTLCDEHRAAYERRSILPPIAPAVATDLT